MPGNVAVEDPNAGVVELEADGDVAVPRQQGDITTRRVVVVEGAVVQVRLDEGPVLLGEDDKVVAVKVEGMGRGDVDLVLDSLLGDGAVHRDDDVDPRILVVVLVDHRRGGIPDVGLVPEEFDGRVTEVGPHWHI